MYYQLYETIRDRYFDELRTMPAPIREALIFQRTAEQIPLQINAGDRLAGRYGYEECPTDIAPSPQSAGFTLQSYFSSEDERLRVSLRDDFLLYGSFGPGHTCIDYGEIVRCGLGFVIQKVEKELSGANVSAEKDVYLQAMLISLNAVRIYAGRLAEIARSLEQAAENAEGKARLQRMALALVKVPMEPAESFFEGLQSVWILHSLIPIADNNWASISLGRLDQFLYPLYMKSLKDGYTRSEAGRDLESLFQLLDSYGDGACALNIGGLDFCGNDQMNELSELIIEVEKRVRLRSPILAARISRKTPKKILDSLIDEKLFTIGQPTFYGEEACRKAVMERGIREEEAASFSVNSCMGLVVAGKEIADMWGWMFNMHLPLELAINGGKPLHGELPFALKTESLASIYNLNELFQKYRQYCRELLSVCLPLNRKTALECAANFPDPLLSALTEGCIEKGLDRAIGAAFQNVTVEAMGLVNTGNAITAIDSLVFQEKKYTLPQLVSAAQGDYRGNESIRQDIKACGKYGENAAPADAVCRELVDLFAGLCREFDFDYTRYIPSLHTLDANVDYGRRLYSTLDGRLRGEPVSKNAGATNDVRTAEPTSMVLSAASLSQYKFSGGQPIDLHFDRDSLLDGAKREKIQVLLCTYFQNGGMQLQVNSIDSQTLEAAYRDPDSYRDLIVRVGGYSLRFCDMSAISRRELIERTRREEGKM